MASKPWQTTDELVEAVQRKISFPISQNTFTRSDIRKFLNEEMLISQVPSVLSYHEEYYVQRVVVPLESNKSIYPIPDRAIGMRLRDLMWSDPSGNLFEMTRIDAGDKAYFQRNIGANQAIHKFYIEGNDIILSPAVTSSPTGSLNFYIYIRPNQLVADDRACISTSFNNKITVSNASLVAGDTVTINDVIFTAVAGVPSTNEFQIGGTSVITATNLAAAITTNGVCTATNGSPAVATVTLKFITLSKSQDVQSSNDTALAIPSTYQYIEFDAVNTTYTDPESNVTENLYIPGVLVDFLQNKPGHRILNYDVQLPSNSISGAEIKFNRSDVPSTMVLGDYVCLANECIIPYLPPDMHTGLAERAASRVLASIGDTSGLQISAAKLEDIDKSTDKLIGDRVDGSGNKVFARHSLLRYQKTGTRRRY